MIRFSENSLNQTKMKKVEKMNWKIISIILVVILAAVAVSGCIGSPVSDADDIYHQISQASKQLYH